MILGQRILERPVQSALSRRRRPRGDSLICRATEKYVFPNSHRRSPVIEIHKLPILFMISEIENSIMATASLSF
jgi:hypothetical protein